MLQDISRNQDYELDISTLFHADDDELDTTNLDMYDYSVQDGIKEEEYKEMNNKSGNIPDQSTAALSFNHSRTSICSLGASQRDEFLQKTFEEATDFYSDIGKIEGEDLSDTEDESEADPSGSSKTHTSSKPARPSLQSGVWSSVKSLVHADEINKQWSSFRTPKCKSLMADDSGDDDVYIEDEEPPAEEAKEEPVRRLPRRTTSMQKLIRSAGQMMPSTERTAAAQPTRGLPQKSASFKIFNRGEGDICNIRRTPSTAEAAQTRSRNILRRSRSTEGLPARMIRGSKDTAPVRNTSFLRRTRSHATAEPEEPAPNERYKAAADRVAKARKILEKAKCNDTTPQASSRPDAAPTRRQIRKTSSFRVFGGIDPASQGVGEDAPPLAAIRRTPERAASMKGLARRTPTANY